MEEIQLSQIVKAIMRGEKPNSVPDNLIKKAYDFVQQVKSSPFYLTPEEIAKEIAKVPKPPEKPKLEYRSVVVTKRGKEPSKRAINIRKAEWYEDDYVYRWYPSGQCYREWIKQKVQGYEWEEEYEELTEESEKKLAEWEKQAKEWFNSLTLKQKIAVLAVVSFNPKYCSCGINRPHVCVSYSWTVEDAIQLPFYPHDPYPVKFLLDGNVDHAVVAEEFLKLNI